MDSKTDTALFRRVDPAVGLALLSRWPVRIKSQADWARGAASAWCWPILGAVIAVPAAVLAQGAVAVGLPAVVAALLALGILTFTTGALHEDGLADSFDGVWGGADAARRLAIMKDSQIGSYGTLALIFSLALRVALLSTLIDGGQIWASLLGAAMLSRAAMVGVMATLPYARNDGLAHSVGRPGRATSGIALVLAGIACLALFGIVAIFAVLVVAIATAGVAAVAQRKIGGQTGDILGATQQVAETMTLLTLAVLL